MQVPECSPVGWRECLAMTIAGPTWQVLQALLMCFLFVPDAVAQDYEIKLAHPINVGDKVRLVANGRHRENMTVFAGQQQLQQKVDEINIDLIATLTALEVDSRGKPTKFSAEIEKVMFAPAGSVSSALAPGTVVISGLDGQQFVSTVNGVPLDSRSNKALSIVIPTHYTGVSDDDVFGTSERKKVGDSWPVNTDVAAQSLNVTFPMSVSKNDLSGRSTLEGVVKEGSAEYLVISANMRVEKLSIPLPDGVRIQSGQLVATFFGRFPVAPGRLPLNQSAKVFMTFSGIRGSDPVNPDLTFKGVVERSLEREYQSLP